MVTSHGQGALSALVIMATQINPNGVRRRPEITSAGRRFSARRSAYGNGTTTMSKGSKPSFSGRPVGADLREAGARRIIE
jgi:hypothetical protein